MLTAHNFYRKAHNASDLTWNDTLTTAAQKWSDGCKFEHSVRLPCNPKIKTSSEAKNAFDTLVSMDGANRFGMKQGQAYGENLAIGYMNATANVDAWALERNLYNFGKPGFDAKTGHFTQLVWRNTTSVGCGRTNCQGQGWLVVCEYNPAGKWFLIPLSVVLILFEE